MFRKFKELDDSELKTLKNMCLNGNTYREISKKINRSFYSVSAKAHRMCFIKKTNYTNSVSVNKKISDSKLGEKNPNRKGDLVSYKTLHSWIKRHKKRPKKCPEYKKKNKLELCNISGKYKRDINDFKWLYRKCH